VQSVIGLEGVSMFWDYLALPVGGVFAALGIIGNFLDPQRLGRSDDLVLPFCL
jgi:TRAP-type C4-dicarboxylate transport system permease small subunit